MTFLTLLPQCKSVTYVLSVLVYHIEIPGGPEISDDPMSLTKLLLKGGTAKEMVGKARMDSAWLQNNIDQ